MHTYIHTYITLHYITLHDMTLHTYIFTYIHTYIHTCNIPYSVTSKTILMRWSRDAGAMVWTLCSDWISHDDLQTMKINSTVIVNNEKFPYRNLSFILLISVDICWSPTESASTKPHRKRTERRELLLRQLDQWSSLARQKKATPNNGVMDMYIYIWQMVKMLFPRLSGKWSFTMGPVLNGSHVAWPPLMYVET